MLDEIQRSSSSRWSQRARRRRPRGWNVLSVLLVMLLLLVSGRGKAGGLAEAVALLPESGSSAATSTTEKTAAAATTIADAAGASAAASAASPVDAAAVDASLLSEAEESAEAEAAHEKELEAKDAAAAAAAAAASAAVPPQPEPAPASSVPRPLVPDAEAASPPTTKAATPTPAAAPSAEARAKDLLRRANAVLALRKAGLLPGSGALDPAMASKTVDAVNANAPAFEAAGGVKFRPSLTQTVGENGAAPPAAAPAPARKSASLRAKWAGADAWATAPASTVIESYASKWRPTLEGAQNSTAAAKNRTAGGGLPFNLGSIRVQAAAAGAPSASESVEAAQAEAAAAAAAAAPAPAQMRVTTLANGTRIMSPTQPGQVAANALIGEYGPLREGESIGAVIQVLFGFRIATPFFGTGFNFCVDRYWGSFPKVGVVIPNAAAWLLPDLAQLFADNGGITANLELPSLGAGGGLPAGARAEPSSDGFVIWLPSVQPLYISNLGFRFGLQIAQLFGIDFGFGLLKIGCRVDFVRV